MRNGDIYQNWKTRNYYEFIGIAAPKMLVNGTDMPKDTAKHADTLEILTVYFLQGLILVEADIYMTLYRSKVDGELWLRPVDDFFGYKEIDIETKVKRFELISHKPEEYAFKQKEEKAEKNHDS